MQFILRVLFDREEILFGWSENSVGVWVINLVEEK